MSDESPGWPPPGWYWDGAAYRWWDGRGWGPAAPTPTAPGASPQPERGLAVLAHLLVVVAGILGPLIMLLALDRNRPYERRHAREALNFSLTVLVAIFGILALFAAAVVVLVATVGEGAFGLFFGLWALIMLMAFVPLVFGILAAVRAWQGVDYRYPICIRFVSDPADELAALGIPAGR